MKRQRSAKEALKESDYIKRSGKMHNMRINNVKWSMMWSASGAQMERKWSTVVLRKICKTFDNLTFLKMTQNGLCKTKPSQTSLSSKSVVDFEVYNYLIYMRI